MTKPKIRLIICGGLYKKNKFRLKTIVDKLIDLTIIESIDMIESQSATDAPALIKTWLPDVPTNTWKLNNKLDTDNDTKASLRNYRMLEESGGNLLLVFGDEPGKIIDRAKDNYIQYILVNYSKSNFSINGVII